ncbi:hypothetical protein KFK09_000690 [Dendrobium nobile]|uniref:Transmembrane protein n=1 Tax=Dendrobium nobile TaxID=94219 RepID=A0A8T3C9A6_DENNO|nr:hypothetical protein KFK09_000690 [Dendrobium nobile]
MRFIYRGKKRGNLIMTRKRGEEEAAAEEQDLMVSRDDEGLGLMMGLVRPRFAMMGFTSGAFFLHHFSYVLPSLLLFINQNLTIKFKKKSTSLLS